MPKIVTVLRPNDVPQVVTHETQDLQIVKPEDGSLDLIVTSPYSVVATFARGAWSQAIRSEAAPAPEREDVLAPTDAPEPPAEWEHELLTGSAPAPSSPEKALDWPERCVGCNGGRCEYAPTPEPAPAPTRFAEGDLVRLHVAESASPRVVAYDFDRWEGFLATVARVGDFGSLTLRPLSTRPDGYGLTQFSWTRDDVERVGTLVPTADPTEGDRVLVQGGATLAPDDDDVDDQPVFGPDPVIATVLEEEDEEGDVYVLAVINGSDRRRYVDADQVAVIR